MARVDERGLDGGVSAAGTGRSTAAGAGQSVAAGAGRFTAPGWVRDKNGALRRETKPRMNRRLPGFDYSQRMIYEITIVLEERRPILGRLVKAGETWSVEPTSLGLAVLACWRKISEFWPQVSLIEAQLMPDHFHGVLFVREQLPLTRPECPEGPKNRRKSLGDIIRGFKAGVAIAWRELAQNRGVSAAGQDGAGSGVKAVGSKSAGRSVPAATAAGVPRWAEGFVDTILFHKGQLAKMIAYLRDNPRRLGVKREHPELFRVLRDLEVNFAAFGEGQKGVDPWCGSSVGHFAAIGNHFLLTRPRLVQVQCSRSLFAYRRERLPGGGWRILRGELGEPLVEQTTPAFEENLTAALMAAKHGAVLVSPCISHGEREIARQAFNAGYRVITLKNKGFSPVYKPGGKLFDTCAAGNLLMIAPINWPYQPAEKPMTRDAAQVLNRIAQLIAGDGAVEINYKGAVMSGVDAKVASAVSGRGRHMHVPW